MKLTYPLIFTAIFLLSACSSTSHDDQQHASSPEAYLQPVGQEVDPISPLTIRVVGYGMASSLKHRSELQRKLMAVRASKMDAYRALAERLYGLQVNGETTVRDMAVQDDRFHSVVQAYMNGGRVVSADVMPDGSVETVLEVIIDQGFRNCLQMVNNKRVNVDCRVSMRQANSKAAHISSAQKKRVRAESAYTENENSFYFID